MANAQTKRNEIVVRLFSMGYEERHIHRAIELCQQRFRNAKNQTDLSVLVEVIERIKKKENAKKQSETVPQHISRKNAAKIRDETHHFKSMFFPLRSRLNSKSEGDAKQNEDDRMPSQCSLSLQEMQNRQKHGLELFSIVVQQPAQQKLLHNPSNWCILIDTICVKLPTVEQQRKVLTWLDERTYNEMIDLADSKESDSEDVDINSSKVRSECVAFIQAIGYTPVTDSSTQYILKRQPPQEIVSAAHKAIYNTSELIDRYTALNTHWRKCMFSMSRHAVYHQQDDVIATLKQFDFALNYGDYYDIYLRLLPISELQLYSRDELVLQILIHIGFKINSLPKDEDQDGRTKLIHSNLVRFYETMTNTEKYKQKIKLTAYYRANTVSQMQQQSDRDTTYALLNYPLTTQYSLPPHQLEWRQNEGVAYFTKKVLENEDENESVTESMNPFNWDILVDAIQLRSRKKIKHKFDSLQMLLMNVNDVMFDTNDVVRFTLRHKYVQKLGEIPGIKAFLRALGYFEDEAEHAMVLYAQFRASAQVFDMAQKAVEYKLRILQDMMSMQQRWDEAFWQLRLILSQPVQLQKLFDMQFNVFAPDPIYPYFELLKKCVAVCGKIQKLSDEQKRQQILFEILRQFGIALSSQQIDANAQQLAMCGTYFTFIYNQICKIEQQKQNRKQHAVLSTGRMSLVSAATHQWQTELSLDLPQRLNTGKQSMEEPVSFQMQQLSERDTMFLNYSLTTQYSLPPDQLEWRQNEGVVYFIKKVLENENANDYVAESILYMSQLAIMGYEDNYINRAIKIHQKSKFGEEYNLSLLVEIIDRLKQKDAWNRNNTVLSRSMPPVMANIKKESPATLPSAPPNDSLYPEATSFSPHFSSTQEAIHYVQTHETIDYRFDNGRYILCKIIEKKLNQQDRILLHPASQPLSMTKHNKECYINEEFYKLAIKKSVSLRRIKSNKHPLVDVKIGDYIDVNPRYKEGHKGWKQGEVIKIDATSAQVKVLYHANKKNHSYWVHLENQEEAAPFSSRYDPLKDPEYINSRPLKRFTSIDVFKPPDSNVNPFNWDILVDAIQLRPRKRIEYKFDSLRLLRQIVGDVMLDIRKVARIKLRQKHFETLGEIPGIKTCLRALGYFEDESEHEMVLYDQFIASRQVIEMVREALDYKLRILHDMFSMQQHWDEALVLLRPILSQSDQMQKFNEMQFNVFAPDAINPYFELLTKCVAVCEKIQKLSDEQKRQQIIFEILRQFGITLSSQQIDANAQQIAMCRTYFTFIYNQICKIEQQKQNHAMQNHKVIRPMQSVSVVSAEDQPGSDASNQPEVDEFALFSPVARKPLLSSSDTSMAVIKSEIGHIGGSANRPLNTRQNYLEEFDTKVGLEKTFAELPAEKEKRLSVQDCRRMLAKLRDIPIDEVANTDPAISLMANKTSQQLTAFLAILPTDYQQVMRGKDTVLTKKLKKKIIFEKLYKCWQNLVSMLSEHPAFAQQIMTVTKLTSLEFVASNEGYDFLVLISLQMQEANIPQDDENLAIGLLKTFGFTVVQINDERGRKILDRAVELYKIMKEIDDHINGLDARDEVKEQSNEHDTHVDNLLMSFKPAANVTPTAPGNLPHAQVYSTRVCDSHVLKCKPCVRIMKSMQAYDRLYLANNDTAYYHDQESIMITLDDYMHLLDAHKNELDELAQQIPTNCDAKNCSSLAVYYHNENEEKQEYEETKLETPGNTAGSADSFYADLMDYTHCYLYHSRDLDLRDLNANKESNAAAAAVPKTNRFNIIITNSSAGTVMDNFFDYLDETLSVSEAKISSIISLLVEQEYDTDAIAEDVENAADSSLAPLFQTEHSQFAKFFDIVKTVSTSSFSIGFRFYYWPHYKYVQSELAETEYFQNRNDHSGYQPHELYVEKKYQSVKEEMLQNTLCRLNLTRYNKALQKTEAYVTSTAVKKISAEQNRYLHYDIWDGTPVLAAHLLILIGYCDYSEFSTALSSTFRKTKLYETIDGVKERNREYARCSQRLRELVELYGKRGWDRQKSEKWNVENKRVKGPFYCGVDCLLPLPEFNIRLCAPTSTSTFQQVARTFAKETGCVIGLNNNGHWLSDQLRVWDCSWFSRYGNEDEKLMMGGFVPIRIVKVKDLAHNIEYEMSFTALFYYDCMLQGMSMEKHPPKISARIRAKLQHLTNCHLQIEKCNAVQDDAYLHDCFRAFLSHRTQIVINLHQIHRYFSALRDFVVQTHHGKKQGSWDCPKCGCQGNSLNVSKCAFCHYEPKNQAEMYGSNNIIEPRCVKLFAGVKHVVIYTTSGAGGHEYVFNLQRFLSVVVDVCTQMNRRINWSIKAVQRYEYINGKYEWMDVSWLSKVWNDNTVKDELNTMAQKNGFHVGLQHGPIHGARVYAEDAIVICSGVTV